MGFLEDLFGQLNPQRPPVDVFGGVQPLDAFGDLMGDGSDALPPITPFGGLDRSFGGFSGGLGSTTSSSPAFWQMPALGGGIGTNRRGAFSTPLPIKEDGVVQPRKRAFSTTPATTTTGTTGTTGASSGTTATPTFSGTALPGTRDTVLRWMPLVQKYSQKYGVPVEVILASIDSESGGDPKAQGKPTNVGTAYGLLQGIDRIWGKHGDLTDPDYNLDTIVGQLMAPAWNKYHSAAAVRAVTYGGPGAVEPDGTIHNEWGDKALGGWTIGQDVQRYLPKVEAYKRYLQGQQQQPAAAPPQAAGGAADLADLWAWLGGSRAPVTGRFGEQDGPYPGTGHRGMDIGVPTGTRLTSPVEGVVMAAGDVGGGYGNQVRIKTAYGSVLLGHLSSVNVQPGQQVTPGTLLGATGNTGKSTGSHLHFELRDANDNAIDPARYYRW